MAHKLTGLPIGQSKRIVRVLSIEAFRSAKVTRRIGLRTPRPRTSSHDVDVSFGWGQHRCLGGHGRHIGRGDPVKADCTACHQVALLTPEALLRGGLSPEAKVLDLKRASPVPRVREEGENGGFGQVGGPVSPRWNETYHLTVYRSGVAERR
jgi:hypothetical protein